MSQSTTTTAPSAIDLLQTGPLQQRSLSLPRSRIVLNPQDFMSEASEVAQNCGPTFPLGLGYYAFDQATTVPQFLSLWAVEPGSSSHPKIEPRTIAVPPQNWAARDSAHVTLDDGALTVSLDGGNSAHIGTARAHTALDVRASILRISVRAVTGQWVLYLASGSAEPIMILPGAATLGMLYLDLRTHFPEGLADAGELVISVIGPDAHVTIDELRFVPAHDSYSMGASSHETDWSPGGLGMTGTYASARVRGVDTFVDRDSLVRELEFSEPLSLANPVTLVGRHIARPEWDAATCTVTVTASGSCVAVAVSHGGTIRYYADESELVGGTEGSSVPLGPVGIWAIQLSPGQSRFSIGVGMTPADPVLAVTLAREATRADALERRQHWLGFWNDVLTRMPHPVNFAVQGVDPGDVGAALVRAEYYRAFIGLFSNVLPPQPEIDFMFPTVATGKASMWNYGAPGARSAAAWETFLAIQFLGYIDAPLAWSCFNGLMSLVDDEGSLAGESLPSRKAQTAWVLYAITADKDALAAGYPALRRLLEWQAVHPRWVYGTYDNPGEQDAEFVSSLIIDLGFGAQIAKELGHSADVSRFVQLRDELSNDYREHCFAGPEREAVQHWFPSDDASMRGGPRGFGLQVCMGLAIDDLADWQVSSLLARFDSQFDAEDQLAGFDFVKHPNVGYTVSGLLQNGREHDAQILLNSILRDVIRSGSFAEVYDRAPGRPRPWGVRPSIFGMTQVIDAVWLNNGLRMDLGLPHAVSLPAADGGVSGIVFYGRRISLSVRDGIAELADVGGPSEATPAQFPVKGGGTEFPTAVPSTAVGADL